MNQGKPSTATRAPETRTPAPALYRSGAVARMLRMPVATLRVWERRYGLTRPVLSPGGQRLYSPEDVRRLALVKQLTDAGHAIGRLAPLDIGALERVVATQSQASARHGATGDSNALPPSHHWRVAVIGAALGTRLMRPALVQRLGRPLALLGPFATAAQAAAAVPAVDIDVLLFHEPHLHEGWLARVDAAAPDLAGVPKAVFYGFAADAVCDALAAAGAALLREPQPDAVLAQWLRSLATPATLSQPVEALAAAPGPVPARRWDDAALADFAARSTTIACECPRHVAELLMQLTHFEDYSAQCEHRHAADAELHAYLWRVAADARARFEDALERVALHEGLMLPASAGQQRAGAAADLALDVRRPELKPASP